MRPGDGTYVAEKSRGLLDRILAGGLLKTEKDLAYVFETRLVLATDLAALAAEHSEHEGIFESIAERNADRAREAMQSHLLLGRLVAAQ